LLDQYLQRIEAKLLDESSSSSSPSLSLDLAVILAWKEFCRGCDRDDLCNDDDDDDDNNLQSLPQQHGEGTRLMMSTPCRAKI